MEIFYNNTRSTGVKINSKFIYYILFPTIILFELIGTISNIGTYIALLLCLLLVFYAFIKKSNIDIYFIILSMPFAVVFKISPDSSSLFTYLILVSTLTHILRIKFNRNLLIVFFSSLLLSLLTQWVFNSFSYSDTLKFYTMILFSYIILSNKDLTKNYKLIIMLYVTGVILSSIVSFSMKDLFNFSEYVINKNVGGGISDYRLQSRFSGLYNDPNYYAVNTILSLVLLVFLFHKKNINYCLFIIMSCLLIFFSILTYSKSSIIMLIIPVMFLLLSNLINKRYLINLIFIVLVVALIVLFFHLDLNFINVMKFRFNNNSSSLFDKNSFLNELTTGRLEIWRQYINFFENNTFELFFGTGIGSDLVNNLVAHNTYIEMIYHFGIFGSILIVALFVLIIHKTGNSKNIFNYFGFITIFIMYFFLSELFFFDMIFHFIVSTLILNSSQVNGQGVDIQ